MRNCASALPAVAFARRAGSIPVGAEPWAREPVEIHAIKGQYGDEFL